MSKRRRKKVYAFIDTNIFLDFYRTNHEASLKLLERLKSVKNNIICTYQVEMEYKKNRQSVILSTLNEIKNRETTKLPTIIANSPTSKSLKSIEKNIKDKIDVIQSRIVKILKSPSKYDIVYQVLEEIFHSKSSYVLTRDMAERRSTKRLALRRFILGYPPRKRNDTSTGDAVNWEWLIHCGNNLSGKIIIVSRDSDYGIECKKEYFLNDYLLQEYKERVGPRKQISYTAKLSDALKELHVVVSKEEIEAEEDIISEIESTAKYIKENVSKEKIDQILADLEKILENS